MSYYNNRTVNRGFRGRISIIMNTFPIIIVVECMSSDGDNGDGTEYSINSRGVTSRSTISKLIRTKQPSLRAFSGIEHSGNASPPASF